MDAQRWALAQATAPANPGAGYVWGRPRGARPEGAMTVPGTDRTTSMGDWHPTVVHLLVLLVIELFAYAGLRYVFRSALGG